MALIVLAGGKSTRMGGNDKARLPLGRDTMAGTLLRRIGPLFRETFVIAGDANPYAEFPVQVIPDQYPGLGPVGGIHAGLAASRDPYSFVLACDLPLMRVEVVRYLIAHVSGSGACPAAAPMVERVSASSDKPDGGNIELVIPFVNGFFEPVAAVYAKGVGNVLEKMIRRGDYRLLNLLPMLQTRSVREEELRRMDPALESFINVNTPARYEQVREILRRSGE